MRVLGIGMLFVILLAAGFAAFGDGEGLTPTADSGEVETQAAPYDGGGGMPTPAPR